ncbi:hypothetical protein L9F63_012027, partial [Diploptera punctata]
IRERENFMTFIYATKSHQRYLIEGFLAQGAEEAALYLGFIQLGAMMSSIKMAIPSYISLCGTPVTREACSSPTVSRQPLRMPDAVFGETSGNYKPHDHGLQPENLHQDHHSNSGHTPNAFGQWGQCVTSKRVPCMVNNKIESDSIGCNPSNYTQETDTAKY